MTRRQDQDPRDVSVRPETIRYGISARDPSRAGLPHHEACQRQLLLVDGVRSEPLQAESTQNDEPQVRQFSCVGPSREDFTKMVLHGLCYLFYVSVQAVRDLEVRTASGTEILVSSEASYLVPSNSTLCLLGAVIIFT